jgi:excisionase family DNA binding protein
MATTVDSELLSLPEAAGRLGLHRATVNDMVQSGRIAATRVGPNWYIERGELEQFASSYQRPRNAPKRLPRKPAVAPEILERLLEWGEATVAELALVIDMHEGNIRKHLCLAEAQGLAERDEFGRWRPTEPRSR